MVEWPHSDISVIFVQSATNEGTHTWARELDCTEDDVLDRRQMTRVELLREVEHGPDERLWQEHEHPPFRIAGTAR